MLLYTGFAIVLIGMILFHRFFVWRSIPAGDWSICPLR